jgi:indole-3-glycerol phosphate synthase
MTASILERIFAARRTQVARAEAAHPEAEIKKRALARPPARPLDQALRRSPYAIIAEVKKGSPSRGLFDPGFDPQLLARAYAAGGADAISVVTEPDFFFGSLDWLDEIREVVPCPLLRKDFLFCDYQVWESRAAGADAVLLILAMLDDEKVRALLDTVAEAGMQALVEVHNEEEAERARALGVDCVGVNNRNLDTFEVSRDVSRRLVGRLPADAVKVAESGIFLLEHCRELGAFGYSAFLVGEALVRAADPALAIRTLRGEHDPH